MKLFRTFFKFIISICLLCLTLVCAVYVICYLAGPPLLEQQDVTYLFDKNGDKIEHLQTESDSLSLNNISPHLLDATVLTEDKQFYSHHGFDIPGIIRAIAKNIQNGRLKEGASTITQQLARNLYLTHEKTWKRKVKEAFYTIRLEMFYSKEEILASYLNSIYYGHGAYGIDAASTFFFKKDALNLTIAESAMLAGIPKGPTYYSPFNDKQKAFERQEFILKTLLTEKRITTAEYHEAKAAELEFNFPEPSSTFAMHFSNLALKEAGEILGVNSDSIASSGYRIYTTLNTPRQLALEELIAEKIDPASKIEIGALAIDPESGEITALVGGNPHINSDFNRVIDAKRMVGSTFKPFVYYAALEQGFTPTTMLLSEPTTFKINENDFYRPKNYNGYYAYKPITLAQAIAVSDNVYAVKTNLFLTPETVVNTTKKFGITSHLPNVASLALGTASISIDEMVTAYGMIANGGRKIESYTIDKITDKNGKVIFERTHSPGRQILQRDKAFLLTHLMTGMFDNRLGGNMHVTGASIEQQLTRVYAGKSGTTDFDSWMIGFSPQTVAGVWVGFDNNKAMTNVAEGALAKQVWATFMETADEQEKNTNFTIPADITWKMIDPETGLIATEDCKTSKLMYFEKGTEPAEVCRNHNDIRSEEDDIVGGENEGFLKKLWGLFR